jgi:hypothetical protein
MLISLLILCSLLIGGRAPGTVAITISEEIGLAEEQNAVEPGAILALPVVGEAELGEDVARLGVPPRVRDLGMVHPVVKTAEIFENGASWAKMYSSTKIECHEVLCPTEKSLLKQKSK